MSFKPLNTITLTNLSADPDIANSSEGDVYFNTNLDVVRLFRNGAWESLQSGSPLLNNATGFVNREDSNIFIDEFNNFSIDAVSPSGTFTIFVQGNQFTISGQDVLSGFLQQTGLYRIFYDVNGILTYEVNTNPNFQEEALVCYIYWDQTSASYIYFAEERHGVVMDWATHEYLHRTVGTVLSYGFSISNYTVGGNGSADAQAQFALSGGLLFDEDLKIQIVDTNDTSIEFGQVLSPQAIIPVWYKQTIGGTDIWKSNTANTFPLITSTVMDYNYYDSIADEWSLAPATTGSQIQYVSMWIVATNNISNPVIAIVGQQVYGNLNTAKGTESWDNLNLDSLPVAELRPLYRLIFSTDVDYTNTPKAALQDVTDIREISQVSQTGGANDHGSLFGLADDDHPQYAPKDNPAFTGIPTAPTAAVGTNTTQIATTAFVRNAYVNPPFNNPAITDIQYIDTSFNVDQGQIRSGLAIDSATVEDVYILSNGQILFYSDQKIYNGQNTPGFVRLNSDGSLDETFNAGGSGPSFASGESLSRAYIWELADGNYLLAAGGMTGYNGTNFNLLGQGRRMVKVSPAGLADYTFSNNLNFEVSPQSPGDAILAIGQQSTGNIICGGRFSGWVSPANPSNCIMRITTTGTMDPTFNSGQGLTRTTGYPYVGDMSVLPDDRIFITGLFDFYNGVARSGVALLNADGTLDTTFDPGTGFAGGQGGNYTIYSPTDQKFYVAGIFGQTTYNGQPITGIVRLNIDGSIDDTFDANLNSFPYVIDAIRQDSLGKVWIISRAIGYDGYRTSEIIRLNNDGTRDLVFGSKSTFTGDLDSMSIQADDKIIVGGTQSEFGISVIPIGITRINNPTFIPIGG